MRPTGLRRSSSAEVAAAVNVFASAARCGFDSSRRTVDIRSRSSFCGLANRSKLFRALADPHCVERGGSFPPGGCEACCRFRQAFPSPGALLCSSE